MYNSVNILAALLLLFSTSYFFMRVFDWIEDRRKKMYSDTMSEFTSDIYKIQIKWSKRGEFGFSKTLQQVIDGYNPSEKEELSSYAKNLKDNA